MKVSKERLAENRSRILDAAGRMFRERGFETVTIAEIMREAGLTHGAFYGHFRSKEDLVARAIEHALAETSLQRAETLAAYAGRYLGAAHRNAASRGCVFAALGSEAVRSPGETRHVLTEGLEQRIAAFAGTPAADGDDRAVARRRMAVAGWCAMVGALTLSRLVDDPDLSRELLDSTRDVLAGGGVDVAGRGCATGRPEPGPR